LEKRGGSSTKHTKYPYRLIGEKKKKIKGTSKLIKKERGN